jgi:hypothetical protein
MEERHLIGLNKFTPTGTVIQAQKRAHTLMV